MDQPTLIDLTGRKGASFVLQYEDARAPFAIYITDLSGKELYYYRLFDKPTLHLNLPVHPDKVVLRHLGAPKLDSHILTELKNQISNTASTKS